MAYTFNGIGTTYYGKRQLPDGTYITTKWVVFVFVPVVPLGSYRIVAAGSPQFRAMLPMLASNQTMTVQKVPLAWAQVAGTYAVVAAAAGIIAVAAMTGH